MPKSHDEIDDIIREALEPSDSDPTGFDADPSMAEKLTDVFRGRHRLLAIGGGVMNLVVFALAIFSGIRMLQATEDRGVIVWGAALLLCFGVVTAIKIWYWLEMGRLALTREIKRVELRVAQMAAKLGE